MTTLEIIQKRDQAIAALTEIKEFLPYMQRVCLIEGMKGEEREHFITMALDLAERIKAMPKTYEQDGAGENAMVYLHYFGPGDWYITEKDSDPDGEGQVQAFGCANLGYGPELGYISIPELLAHQGIGSVELDLYWTPKPLKDIKKACE